MSGQLPTTHPLIAELSSLRNQLAQYQRNFHQTSIQLQGSKLELSLVLEDNTRLHRTLDSLRAEVETLRNNPAPPPIPPQSTALTELSLAHRRLSTKLDLTEGTLSSTQLELANTKSELVRLQKDRDGDRATMNELRRERDEWEERMGWERGERRRIEEQKKLCELALKEYATLVQSLDPNAVPPSTPPNRSASPNILTSTPTVTVGSPTSPTSPSIPPKDSLSLDVPSQSQSQSQPNGSISNSTSPPTLSPDFNPSPKPKSSSENISNLLIGQRGVQRLLKDCTEIVNSREQQIRQLTSQVEELEHTISTLQTQLSEETSLRISCSHERDRVIRDDASAAKVVERYMTFTQKTHSQIHMHLSNLRIRSSATAASLRGEIMTLTKQLEGEISRTQRITTAVDELSQGLARESAGRRREVALRLGMISNEEIRERKVEMWLDRVRLARKGAEGAVLEATELEGLLDEGVNAVTTIKPEESGKRWRVFGRRKEVKEVDEEESSVTRVLLAEELVSTLVQDLQIETERRLDLEKQRVEWLAREAIQGVSPEDHSNDNDDDDKTKNEDGLMFDLGAEGDLDAPSPGPGAGAGQNGSVKHSPSQLSGETMSAPAELTVETSDPDSSPLMEQLRNLFTPLEEKSSPLVKSLHDLTHALSSLRKSIPDQSSPASPNSPMTSFPKGKFLGSLNKKIPPLSDPILKTLLEGLHEVIEDARVDLEISRADEERVYRGFEALLNVGNKSGIVKGYEVLSEGREYISERMDSKVYEKLENRIGDIEGDLGVIKAKIHEIEGGIILSEESLTEDMENGGINGSGNGSVWENLGLKTVSPVHTRVGSPLSAIASPLLAFSHRQGSNTLGGGENGSPDGVGPRRPNALTMVSNVGRSFSAGVIGAPRKVTIGIAGGLGFKRAVSTKGREQEVKGLLDDDVE